ncbi:hypothetical protein [Streptomyces sp. NPDC048560]|uniref:hypothetical protein n=1 Tax=Streptomyces sp. NPDC048560 TaxID=3155488 RepID=UPI00341F7FB2
MATSGPSTGPSPSASASPSAAPSGSPSALPSGSPSALPSGASGASGSAGPPSGSAAPPPAGSSASPSASPERSPLAGRPAGEGRVRPGRSLTPLEIARADALLEEEEEPEPDIGEVAPVEVTPSPPGRSGQSAPQAMSGPAVRQVQEVSLGAGIALVGMGLGFLALRMRRAR